METATFPAADTLALVTPDSGFRELYQRHSTVVYRTALRVTGNAADAEDVLQTVFLRILDRKVAVDNEWSPEGFLRRAATNASIDLLRRKSKNRESSLPEGFEPGMRETPLLLKERLRRALATLPHAHGGEPTVDHASRPHVHTGWAACLHAGQAASSHHHGSCHHHHGDDDEELDEEDDEFEDDEWEEVEDDELIDEEDAEDEEDEDFDDEEDELDDEELEGDEEYEYEYEDDEDE